MQLHWHDGEGALMSFDIEDPAEAIDLAAVRARAPVA